MKIVKIAALATLFSGFAPLAAIEQSDWSYSAGIAGTYLNSGGNDAQTFYWGPYATVGLQATESTGIRAEARHSRDRLLYDGLGNVARQSMTGLGMGLSFDATDHLVFDADYKFRFGENAYGEHEGSVAAEYDGLSIIRFGGDAEIGRRSYVFPGSGTAVSALSRSFTLDVVPVPAPWLEVPLSASISSSEFSTNASVYTVYLFSAGTTFYLFDRRLVLGAAFAPGRDSSNYTIMGGDFRVRIRATDNITLRATASVSTYSFTSTATARGKRQAGASLNPLGNTDSFSISTVGFDVSYNY
ncbi:MAG: hypothetical protein ACOY5B_01100 [Spirochaetota bacterium]